MIELEEVQIREVSVEVLEVSSSMQAIGGLFYSARENPQMKTIGVIDGIS